jgi:hypothetical protein
MTEFIYIPKNVEEGAKTNNMLWYQRTNLKMIELEQAYQLKRIADFLELLRDNSKIDKLKDGEN